MSFTGLESYNSSKNFWITIIHLPTSQEIKFKGVVQKFSDKYESKWNSEEVYGRSDPLETFQNTTRMISLGWSVPSATLEEAKENFNNCAKLARFMYPVYGSTTNAIVSPPLLSIKYANLVTQGNTNALIGRVNGFNYTPDFDADGVYDLDGEIFAKTVNIELEFRVFHTEPIGWSESDKEWRTKHSAASPKVSAPVLNEACIKAAKTANAALEESIGKPKLEDKARAAEETAEKVCKGNLSMIAGGN